MNVYDKKGLRYYAVWNCICDCGVTIKIPGRYITKSKQPKLHCGCGYKKEFSNGRRQNLVHGWGINDVEVLVINSGVSCPYYATWAGMVARAKGKRTKETKPSVRDSDCCDSWKYFSNFKSWMEQQDWEGKQLDKDILVPGNKIYSPETCAFVPAWLNLSMTQRATSGPYPIGVSGSKDGSRVKQYSACYAHKSLGRYMTVELAHKAWQQAKVDALYNMVSRYAAEPCFNTLVAEALIKRAWVIQLQNHKNEETIIF